MDARLLFLPALLVAGAALSGCGGGGGGGDPVAEGRQIFRFDTFGDERQWTDALRMHQAIQQAVSPNVALSVGLKVDADALPASVKQGIANGTVDLDDPQTTLALIQLDAVVGVKGEVEQVNDRLRLKKVGVTCALCHSTVDDSFAAGIGKRLDGWANRDLNPGAIIALSPALDQATKDVYNSWGPGRYDPRFNIDGISKPVVIPPAYGLAGVAKTTYTGDGEDIAYWNRYVAVTQMGGLGTFSDPRLPLTVTHGDIDLVSGKLPALQAYQLSLAPPAPPAGSFNPAAAARGRLLFEGKAQCATCHTGDVFTDAARRLHPRMDSMAEPENPSYALRSATKRYRSTPLRGNWQHPPYFHDGSAATQADAVARYNTRLNLGLTPAEIADVAQYLKSL